MSMFSWNRRACLPALIPKSIRALEDSPLQLNTTTTISSFKPCFHGDGLYLMPLISHQRPTDIKSLNSIHCAFALQDLAADCPFLYSLIQNPLNYYHTQVHFSWPPIRFQIGLVSKALGGSRNLTVLPHYISARYTCVLDQHFWLESTLSSQIILNLIKSSSQFN